jgi:transcriptional regulator NrdR family protein
VIACPECGERTRSTESRVTPSGSRRRRVCPRGHKCTTIETVVPTGERHGDAVLVRRDQIEKARERATALSEYLAAVLEAKEQP